MEKVTRNASIGAIPHLGMGIIYSYFVDANYDVEFHNSRDFWGKPDKLEKLIKKIQTDGAKLVALSVMDINIDRMIAIANAIPPEIMVLIGGKAATYAIELIYEKLTREAMLVSGDFEPVAQELLKDLESGKLKKNYFGGMYEFSDKIKDYPHLKNKKADYVSLPGFRKTPFVMIELGRGCPESCNFCHDGLSKNVVKKPLNIVKEEINRAKRLHRIVIFPDQNLMAYPPDYLNEVFDLINDANLLWIGEGTIFKIIKNKDLLRKMAKNCLSFLAGVENLGGKVVGSATKNELNNNFEDTIALLRELKMPVTWSTIVGLDTQKIDIFQYMARRIVELGITPIMHTVVARPGTPYYEKVFREGRIETSASTQRDMKYGGAHRPTYMSSDMVKGGNAWLHGQVFTKKEIVKRFARNLLECGPKYAMGLLALEMLGYSSAKKLTLMYSKQLKEFKKLHT